jgi:predicted HicB family RNase H-like nuclease
MTDARISVRVPRDLYDRAVAKAKCEDITLSQVLRRCLREWVKGDSPEETQEDSQQDNE